EAQLRALQDARALDIDRIGAVDHDLADRLVAKQGLERAEADGFVDQGVDQSRGVGVAHHRWIGGDDLPEDRPQAGAQLARAEMADFLATQVDLPQQPTMQDACCFEGRIIGSDGPRGPIQGRGRAILRVRTGIALSGSGSQYPEQEAADENLVALEQGAVLVDPLAVDGGTAKGAEVDDRKAIPSEPDLGMGARDAPARQDHRMPAMAPDLTGKVRDRDDARTARLGINREGQHTRPP